MIDALNKRRPTVRVIVRVALGAATAIILGSGLAHAHSNDWAAPFMGGMMAGRVLSHIQEQKERQTQAMEMARGGAAYQGYGGYSGGYGGGFAGYGGGYGRPAYEPPPQYGAPPGCR